MSSAPTEEGDGTFTPDRWGGREFIPCFIYDSDQDLSKVQRTRGKPIASDGTLNVVDVINYLRAHVVRTHPPQASAPAEKHIESPNPEHARKAG